MLFSLNIGQFLSKIVNFLLLFFSFAHDLMTGQQAVLRHEFRHLFDAFLDIDSKVEETTYLCIKSGNKIAALSLVRRERKRLRCRKRRGPAVCRFGITDGSGLRGLVPAVEKVTLRFFRWRVRTRHFNDYRLF